jgi:di/tricarboxylate transporter
VTQLLGSQVFIQFLVPLIAALLSVFLRYVSRSDKHTAGRKEDWAFGFDLSLAALLFFIVDSAAAVERVVTYPTQQPNLDKLASTPWVLLAMFLGLWGMSTVVRKAGWEDEGRLRVFGGIVLPNFFGILLLAFAISWSLA